MPPLDKPPLDKPPLDRPAEDRQRAYGDAARTLAAIEARRILDHLLQLQAIPSPTGYTDSIVRHVCGWLHEHGIDYELTRRGAIRANLRGEVGSPDRAVVGHVDTLGAQVTQLKRSEEHKSELQSLMRTSYAVFRLKTKKQDKTSYKPTIITEK